MLTVLVMLVGLPSCDSEDEGGEFVIWDLAPVVVNIRIVDASGANLLDESTEGNWVREPFTLTCDDEIYELKWQVDKAETDRTDMPHSRYYMPRFYGFVAPTESYWNGKSWEYSKGVYYLSFGEFAGEDNLDLSLQLQIPHLNQVFDIDVTHRCQWKGNEPYMSTEFSLNGVPVEKNLIEIVLPRLPKQ